MAKGAQRPITQALEIVKATQPLVILGRREPGYVLSDEGRDQLLMLLTDVNAASGTTDHRSAKKRTRTIRLKARKAKKPAKS